MDTLNLSCFKTGAISSGTTISSPRLLKYFEYLETSDISPKKKCKIRLKCRYANLPC